MNDNRFFPQPPVFSKEKLEKADLSGDYRPILFEWYKYVGLTSNYIASISRKSESFKNIPEVHYAILIGLLNRCSRLILSNIELSHNGLYGETIQIIERCIFESSTKIIWLCLKNEKVCFNQYLADGLKSDIELKKCIEKNIEERNGDIQIIESRMISSIDEVIKKSGLSVDEISLCKKLPTLDKMLTDIVMKDSRLFYVVNQKVGSHSTHGTWTNLLKYYLKQDNGEFVLRDHDVEVQDIQYISSSLHVLNAIIVYIRYVFSDDEVIDNLTGIFSSIQDEIKDIYNKRKRDNFENIKR